MPSNDLSRLFEAALTAQRAAYAPYSGYRVGAALRTPSASDFFRLQCRERLLSRGICAEAGAISAMVAAGERVITEMLVLGDGEALATPCGACRQRIREFAAPETPIHIADRNGIRSLLQPIFAVAAFLWP